MTDLLNLHGKQTVANLQMSFSGAGDTPHTEDVGDEPKDGLRLDLDLRPADDLGAGDGRKQQNGYHRVPKIFSQVLASRGERAGDEEDEEEEEDDRLRRRGRSEAISRRFVPQPPNLLTYLFFSPFS